MNKARKGPAFLVIFLMLLLIAAYIYAAYQTVKPARGLIYNGSGNPATLKSFILNLSLSSLKTPDRIASVIHGLLQTLDDHVISGPVIHLHMYPVTDLMPQKCPSER